MSSKSNRTQRHAIGGVFPLADESGEIPQQPLLQHWSKDAAATYCFHNARSALHYVLRSTQARCVWLPAYLCSEILQATHGISSEVRYFPLTENMCPDIPFLAEVIRPSDAVVAINYFGHGFSEAWLDFVANRHKVLWIEDCAQAIDSGMAGFSDFQIYSPRKIVGAPDGGVLVDVCGRLSPPTFSPLPNKDFITPYRLRAQDLNDENHNEWYQAFQSAERQMNVCTLTMSDESHNILRRTDARYILSARQKNYRHLHEKLGELALFNSPANVSAPMCFPVISDRVSLLGSYLADRKIFCPRYWRNLPFPGKDFPHEHELSKKILALPCDQRYSVEDTARVVRHVRAFQK